MGDDFLAACGRQANIADRFDKSPSPAAKKPQWTRSSYERLMHEAKSSESDRCCKSCSTRRDAIALELARKIIV